MLRTILLAAAALAALLCTPQNATAQTAQPEHTFQVGKGAFLLDGKPFTVKAAELHYPRIPREYWEHRIQMCRALGMNTVCLYVFWNLHEPAPGQFDFSGNADVREFCRLAQKNGMWVILRPGPYVCAEWEMGGLPWWLLKHDGVTLRDDEEPYFLQRVALFEKEVAKQLADMTIEHGGPIIMVQVENEYGSYAQDKTYISKVRDTLRECGFDKVALFQCDWASNFTLNGLPDLVWTMNFGTGADIPSQFKRLAELRPDAPRMCSEFWSGWFDKWGARHETRPADKMVSGITQMLSQGISFSLYMTHGGTSFGHWAGANSPGFAPDVTSYDYDAPIDEQGAPTPKYHLLRDALAKFADEPLPEVPAAIPTGSIDTISSWTFTPLTANALPTVTADSPLTFESLDLGWGSVLYQGPDITPRGDWAELEIDALHDYAIVSLADNKWSATVSRVSNEQAVSIPREMLGKTSSLKILVEGMGRINFGRAIADRKGITTAVRLKQPGAADNELKGWKMTPIPDDYQSIAKACRQTSQPAAQALSAKGLDRAGYYRATFSLKKTHDTFLNLSLWGKGQVYVNGHALGRFWAIGPQQTLYLPAPWLKEGQNEIIVADIKGPRQLKVWGQDKPELNLLQPKTETPARNVQKPDLDLFTLAAKGTLPKDEQTAEIQVNAKASVIALEILSTHNKGQAAVAEIRAYDKKGEPISQDSWQALFASSQDIETGNNNPSKAFDLQESTFWQTQPRAKAPHLLVVDLGAKQTISKIVIVRREGEGAPGAIKEYRLMIK